MEVGSICVYIRGHRIEVGGCSRAEEGTWRELIEQKGVRKATILFFFALKFCT